MARPPRQTFPGALHHVVCRGNNREPIFRNDEDRNRYLKSVAKCFNMSDFSLFAYTLMDNHVHLLIQTGQISLSKILHSINTSYTMYFNIKHDRCGHLFQGRFYSSIVDKQSYLVATSKYIHLNPVRAGMVEKPEEWPWSSCRCYLGLETSELVDASEALKLSGFDDNYNRYDKFLNESLETPLPIVVKSGAWYVGDSQFIRRISVKMSK